MIAKKTSLVALLVVGVVAAGCAGHREREAAYSSRTEDTLRNADLRDRDRRETGPSASAELTRARTLIDQAERSGGQQYAAAELQSARNKLQLAESVRDDRKGSRKDRDITTAQRAEEAAADAELAAALTARGAAEKSAGEVGAATDALRRESGRQSTDLPIQESVRPQGVER